jgi:hypothetical protein
MYLRRFGRVKTRKIEAAREARPAPEDTARAPGEANHPGEPIIPHIRVFWTMSDLAPRKGHFSFGPWYAMGKPSPKKNAP